MKNQIRKILTEVKETKTEAEKEIINDFIMYVKNLNLYYTHTIDSINTILKYIYKDTKIQDTIFSFLIELEISLRLAEIDTEVITDILTNSFKDILDSKSISEELKEYLEVKTLETVFYENGILRTILIIYITK